VLGSRSSLLIVVLTTASPASGCGGDDAGTPPAGDAGAQLCPEKDADGAENCFPIDESRPEGTVELGTGYDEWRPMESEEHLYFGIQGGFHFLVNARLRGLDPGTFPRAWSECNAKTRIQGYFVDNGNPINVGETCPFLFGYSPVGNDEYALTAGIELQFDTCLKDRDLFGRPVRIVLEIIDPQGRYAKDETVVTGLAPEGWHDAGPTSSRDAAPDEDAGSRADAGAADAGAVDAGGGDAGSGDAGSAPDPDCPNALP
jgi:hypothetical protein